MNLYSSKTAVISLSAAVDINTTISEPAAVARLMQLSISPSIRLSVTCWYCVKMTQARVVNSARTLLLDL